MIKYNEKVKDYLTYIILAIAFAVVVFFLLTILFKLSVILFGFMKERLWILVIIPIALLLLIKFRRKKKKK